MKICGGGYGCECGCGCGCGCELFRLGSPQSPAVKRTVV